MCRKKWSHSIFLQLFRTDKQCRYLRCFKWKKNLNTPTQSYSENPLLPWQIRSGTLVVDIISGFDQTDFPQHLLESNNNKTMDVATIFSLKWVNICKIPEDDPSLRELIHLLLQLEESSIRKKSLKLPCSVASLLFSNETDSTSLRPLQLCKHQDAQVSETKGYPTVFFYSHKTSLIKMVHLRKNSWEWIDCTPQSS